MIIGIPRALVFWKRPYFWKSFFENLDLKILVSPLTNKEIVEEGVKIADPETCFSQKVYWGHLLWLDGKCDLIFVPRLKTNEEKLEYCLKFFGIPDVAKILVKTPILTVTFDERLQLPRPFIPLNRKKVEISLGFRASLLKIGKKLGKDRKTIKKAIEIAFLKEKELKKKEEEDFLKKIESKKKKIILISHPYNLSDQYINLRVKEKLEKLGAAVIFIDMVPLVSPKSEYLSEIKFHWEFGKEIMESVEEILKYKISGAIQISAFACGCDAVLKEFVEKKFKKNKIPFLYLIIDEHTGEAGFQTRLEAFMDTLR